MMIVAVWFGMVGVSVAVVGLRIQHAIYCMMGGCFIGLGAACWVQR